MIVCSSRWLVSGSAIENRTNRATSNGTQWPVGQLLSKHYFVANELTLMVSVDLHVTYKAGVY